MNRHSISTENLQAILTYLASKPYAEVVNIIQKIVADATPIPAEPAPAPEAAPIPATNTEG